jgi:D-aminoacyl-tRNA deacylase
VRVVLQRVRSAAVRVDGQVTGEVGVGLLALVGVGRASTAADARWLAAKTEGLRIFGDDAGRMDRSVAEVGGGVLAISQFTLYGDASKGRRPSFVGAAEPAHGRRLYEAYADALTVPVGRGVFGAHMAIAVECDGPVTITLSSEGR